MDERLDNSRPCALHEPRHDHIRHVALLSTLNSRGHLASSQSLCPSKSGYHAPVGRTDALLLPLHRVYLSPLYSARQGHNGHACLQGPQDPHRIVSIRLGEMPSRVRNHPSRSGKSKSESTSASAISALAVPMRSGQNHFGAALGYRRHPIDDFPNHRVPTQTLDHAPK